MAEPANVNGARNSEILKPFRNGDDLTERPRDVWLIDLPLNLNCERAQEYASVYEYLRTATNDDGLTVAQTRAALGDRAHERWWEPHWPRPEMRTRIQQLSRYAVTARTSKHHIIQWQAWPTLPDENLVVFLREDDLMFGLLQSRFHALWALRKGSDFEDRPRYTHTSVTMTFPFPPGMTPDVPVAIARAHKHAASIEEAARELYLKREEWLWPEGSFIEVPEDVDALPEVGPNGYPLPKPEAERLLPLRRIPANERSAKQLASRGFTKLYNENPAWLQSKHSALDDAVASAYGWNAGISGEAALEELLKINLQRSAHQS